MKQSKQKNRGIDYRTEQVVMLIRLELYNRAVCCGSKVIQQHMKELQETTIPSLRTIDRILARHCLTHRRTGFYPGDEGSELC